MVPHRRGRPHDPSHDPAFYGGADEGQRFCTPGRPHPLNHCAESCGRCTARSGQFEIEENVNSIAKTNTVDLPVAIITGASKSIGGLPEDTANLMAFMVSSPTKWMTGSALRIDGGEINGLGVEESYDQLRRG